jgi:hypothetical protein
VEVNDNDRTDNHQYPRVLFVLMTKVKSNDPGNLLIRMQFGDWPKGRLAQIHATSNTAGYGEFCGTYYSLQVCDRKFGSLFRWLRSGISEMVALNTIDEQGQSRPTGVLWRLCKIIKKRLGDGLIGSGLWEIIFSIHLSRQMETFVQGFKADLIYCQGYSLGFATLPMQLARKFNLPICFQTTDDWPYSTYRHSPVGWLLRRRAHELITSSSVRLAFGDKMQQEYQRRYGVAFEATYHLDNLHRFPVREGEIDDPVVTILYVGGLDHRRYEAIHDLAAVVTGLSGRLGRIRIRVLCEGLPKEMPRDLSLAAGVEFGSLPLHDELPGVLTSATVLFLPESFTEDPSAIEYSLSTKAHLYMMSQRPILVYGPIYSGTVDYAQREGWGVVVMVRDLSMLSRGLESVLNDATRANTCRVKALDCLKRNHDLHTGRTRILERLSAAVAISDGSNEKDGRLKSAVVAGLPCE